MVRVSTSPEDVPAAGAGPRRVPRQDRSRARVEALLDAASSLVVEGGLGAVTTREVARRAGMPTGTLYQYFADRDALVAALLDRDTATMDAEVARRLALLADEDHAGVESLVRAVLDAFRAAYVAHPAFTALWMRGRPDPVVAAYAREHDRRVAATLVAYARDAGLVPGLGEDEGQRVAYLAVQAGDRVLEVAFDEAARAGRDEPDPAVLEEGVRLISRYLAPYADA